VSAAEEITVLAYEKSAYLVNYLIVVIVNSYRNHSRTHPFDQGGPNVLCCCGPAE
jgi:hypothetical protein